MLLTKLLNSTNVTTLRELRVAQHLSLVGQQPALACCFLGKVLGISCHSFPPPLDIQTFAARYLHVCTTREILVASGGTMDENTVR